VHRTLRSDLWRGLMVQHNCGEVPVVDTGQLIGVVTDRDIVCRVLAAGRKPLEHTGLLHLRAAA
jgi:CBS domain-containing protein